MRLTRLTSKLLFHSPTGKWSTGAGMLQITAISKRIARKGASIPVIADGGMTPSVMLRRPSGKRGRARRRRIAVCRRGTSCWADAFESQGGAPSKAYRGMGPRHRRRRARGRGVSGISGEVAIRRRRELPGVALRLRLEQWKSTPGWRSSRLKAFEAEVPHAGRWRGWFIS